MSALNRYGHSTMYEHMERKQLLNTSAEQSRLLQEVPTVIPQIEELKPISEDVKDVINLAATKARQYQSSLKFQVINGTAMEHFQVQNILEYTFLLPLSLIKNPFLTFTFFKHAINFITINGLEQNNFLS